MNCSVTTTYDGPTVAGFQRVAGRTVQRGHTWSARFLMSLMAAVCFVIGAYLISAKERIFLAVIALPLGLLCLLWVVFQDKIVARASRPKGEPAEIVFQFAEDGFTARTPSGVRSHTYGEVFALCERKEYLYLFLTDQGGCILDKRRFAGGTPTELADYIRSLQKAGKIKKVTTYTLK